MTVTGEILTIKRQTAAIRLVREEMEAELAAIDAEREQRLSRMGQASDAIDGFDLLTRAISCTGRQYVDQKISHGEMSERFAVLHKLRWSIRNQIVALAGHREEREAA